MSRLPLRLHFNLKGLPSYPPFIAPQPGIHFCCDRAKDVRPAPPLGGGRGRKSPLSDTNGITLEMLWMDGAINPERPIKKILLQL